MYTVTVVGATGKTGRHVARWPTALKDPFEALSVLKGSFRTLGTSGSRRAG